MKSVLMSIQPKWCELIASGKKTVEVRKTKPKLETPFKCYIYCTNNKRQYLRKLGTSCQEIFITENRDVLGRTEKVKSLIGDSTTFWEHGGYNGKVIGEFVCNHITNIEVLKTGLFTGGNPNGHCTNVVARSMLSPIEIKNYANKKTNVFAWHISDLVIYDKPKELGEFRKYNPFFEGISTEELEAEGVSGVRMTRPPQSWCYVEGGGNDA